MLLLPQLANFASSVHSTNEILAPPPLFVKVGFLPGNSDTFIQIDQSTWTNMFSHFRSERGHFDIFVLVKKKRQRTKEVKIPVPTGGSVRILLPRRLAAVRKAPSGASPEFTGRRELVFWRGGSAVRGESRFIIRLKGTVHL